MSYSNDITQIRAGLVNYIGACLTASRFEGKAAAHTVVSILTEESLKLSQPGEGEPFDLYILKPMIRGVLATLKQRQAEMSKLPRSKGVIDSLHEYDNTIKFLEELVDVID